MNTIPASEIKQRGISAVDKLLENGSVHVIIRNRPKYVIMTEERYQSILEAEEERILTAYQAVKEDIAAGRYVSLSSEDDIRAWVQTLENDDTE